MCPILFVEFSGVHLFILMFVGFYSLYSIKQKTHDRVDGCFMLVSFEL